MPDAESFSQTHRQAVQLEVKDLCKQFQGYAVLKNIDLEIHPGEIFVIMGPSGSGKSVLLKHFIGLESPDQGDILINGESVRSNNVLAKHRIAMVFQSAALLSSLSVEENVGLYLTEHRIKPPAEIKRIVREKLDVVGLQKVEHKFPSELSGGMKKRVAIARALVMEPQLILYDEPTSELDPLIAVTISQEIYRLNKENDVTTVVVSHDRDLSFGIADRMAIIYDGKIMVVGTPDEVRQCPDSTVQEFLNATFKPAEQSSQS